MSNGYAELNSSGPSGIGYNSGGPGQLNNTSTSSTTTATTADQQQVANVELFRLFNLHKRECEDVGDYHAAKITHTRLVSMRNLELER